MSEEIVTYYDLAYLSNLDRVKRFITLDFEEIKIKTSEVLSSADKVSIEFNTITCPKSVFMAALKKAASCI